MKKVVFMGTPHYARDILETLIIDDRFEVSLVITQPDRPVGRKKILTAPPTKELAESHNIKVVQPQNLNSNDILKDIGNPDFIIVAAFGQILPKSILDIAPSINLHASILPKYRGASPVQQSLLNGDKYSGVTAMMMEEGLDTGDILGFKYFKIPSNMRLEALMKQLTLDACELTIDTLLRFDSLKPTPQLDIDSSLCKKIKKSDGEIEFDNANILYNKYRAYQGWPDIFTKDRLKLLNIELIESNTQNEAGKILEINSDNIVVGCLRGTISIKEVQPISKKAMDIKSYIVGRGIKVGDYIT
ncbi:Methionyl-tRNA formyltransferase [hydrothermal vent metagenome]|uniref:methionyl-tRNA formyltransferase n=1 Tax=hydrothermal vent metagenome TaxID=652676 RepID=A0A1W1EJE7_9ZZZZ